MIKRNLIVLLFVIIALPIIPAYAQAECSIPSITSPEKRPISIWDEVEITVSVAGVENLESVNLYHSNQFSTQNDFTKIPMSLSSGDISQGLWSAKIPPQANNSLNYYFVEVLDDRGVDHSSCTINNYLRYDVAIKPPSFLLSKIN